MNPPTEIMNMSTDMITYSVNMKQGLVLTDYNDKSIVIRGDTRTYKDDLKALGDDMNIIENNINNISNISIYVEEDEIVINYKTTKDTDNEIKIPLDENDESDRLDSLHNWVKEWIPKMKNLKTFKYNTQFVNELDIDFLNISPPPKLNTVYLPSMSELPFKFLDGVKTLHITGQLTEDHLELFDHIPRSVKTVTTSGYDVEKDEIKQWPFKLILE